MDPKLEIQRIQLELSQNLKRATSPAGSPSNQLDNAFEAVRGFELLVGKLYQLRHLCPPSDPIRQATEDFAASVTHDLINIQRKKSAVVTERWVDRYRRIWREEFSIFVFTLVLFLSCTLVGWSFAVEKPEYVPLLMPQGLLEMILQKKAWFESIQESALLDGIGIAWNNIRVCIAAFSLGILLGLGGLYILCFNGIFFGAILGYCYVNDFHEQLLRFVAGHGPLELSIIIASAFASLLYGRAFYVRPFSQFRERLRFGASQAFTVLLGIVPWLVLAASIEVFVSPWDYLSEEAKVTIGILAGLLFWTWTLMPSRKSNY